MNVQSKPANGRKMLIVLAALFAMPVILSTLLYTQGWRPSGAVNYGELVRPPVNLADIQLKTLNGQPVNLAKMQQWALVVAPGISCPDACRRDLHNIRQAHLAQGRERDRLQRIMILNEEHPPAWLDSVRRDYPDMTIVTGTKQDMQNLMRTFTSGSGRRVPSDDIYVVDPAGNFMMRYPSGADPSHIRKDFKRLLSVSQIG